SVSLSAAGSTLVIGGPADNGQKGSAWIFAYTPPPTITSCTPTSAIAGNTVTITGTKFTGATAVSFGGTAASSFTVVSATTRTAVVDTGSNGAVSVSTAGGTAELAGFSIKPPAITYSGPQAFTIGTAITSLLPANT